MEVIGYVASVCIGLILGMLGGGGSILTIPILVYLFHIDAVTASAYSLFIVGVTSLIGAIPKYRDHFVNLRTGIVFGIPSILSIFITRMWIVPSIPEIVVQPNGFVISRRFALLGLFSLLMILAAISILKNKKEPTPENHTDQLSLLILEGLIIGFLTGLVGAGGGFLIIPALVLLTGLSFKTAVGTSLFIIAINSLIGFLGDVLNFQIDWRFLLTITTLAVCGILIGNRLSTKIQAENLRIGFAWFVLVAGCLILVRELLYS
ncbi:MAG TPA: sulfite exporter TauE/SafE family protein [Ohtaekwangia sp.]|nr:sulfite exporter TauE/SafE family protein [Ohtaekwangia sp.]